MSWTTRCISAVITATFTFTLALFTGPTSIAKAASISYADVGPIPPGITYVGISESSGTDPVPLYGPPAPFPIGLSFSPAGFTASSSGGGADITDGQLNFTVTGLVGINEIGLSEGGAFALAGAGTSATEVSAGAILIATVTEINGVSVAPINLATSSAFVAYDLIANPGAGQPWSVGVLVDVAAQLAGLGYDPNQKATRVDVVVNNALVAISELNSMATIDKNQFTIDIVPGNEIPEPSTVALSGLALIGLWNGYRRSQ